MNLDETEVTSEHTKPITIRAAGALVAANKKYVTTLNDIHVFLRSNTEAQQVRHQLNKINGIWNDAIKNHKQLEANEFLGVDHYQEDGIAERFVSEYAKVIHFISTINASLLSEQQLKLAANIAEKIANKDTGTKKKSGAGGGDDDEASGSDDDGANGDNGGGANGGANGANDGGANDGGANGGGANGGGANGGGANGGGANGGGNGGDDNSKKPGDDPSDDDPSDDDPSDDDSEHPKNEELEGDEHEKRKNNDPKDPKDDDHDDSKSPKKQGEVTEKNKKREKIPKKKEEKRVNKEKNYEVKLTQEEIRESIFGMSYVQPILPTTPMRKRISSTATKKSVKVNDSSQSNEQGDIVKLMMEMMMQQQEQLKLQQQNSEAMLAQQRHHDDSMMSLSRSHQNSNRNHLMKTEAIKFPHFSGDTTKYLTFKKTFQKLADDCNFSDAHKYITLRNCLEGSALEAIEAYDDDEDNYLTAWEVLDKKYTDENDLMEANMKLIRDISTTSKKNGESFSKLQDKMMAFIANMRRQGDIMCVVCHKILAQIICEKIGDDVIDELTKHKKLKKTCISTNDLSDFLQLQASISKSKKEDHKEKKSVVVKTFATTSGKSCFACNEDHFVLDCPAFKKADNKFDFLRKHKICVRCAKHKYVYGANCRLQSKCDSCEGKHLTVLCAKNTSRDGKKTVAALTVHPEVAAQENIQTFLNKSDESTNQANFSAAMTILPTVVATTVAKTGEYLPARAMMDNCSQSSYVTEELTQRLKLNKKRVQITCTGLNGSITSKITSAVILPILLDGGEVVKVKALVVKKITTMPTYYQQKIDDWNGLKLADPMYYKPALIPILFGANVIPKFMKSGVVTLNNVLMQETVFGYTLMGVLEPDQKSNNLLSINPIQQEIDEEWNQIEHRDDDKKISDLWEMLPFYGCNNLHDYLNNWEEKLLSFWQLPVTKDIRLLSQHEYCEKLFVEKHRIDETNRIITPTPYISDAQLPSDSFGAAFRTLNFMEQKFRKNSKLREMSDKYMDDYEKQGHMTEIHTNLRDRTGKIYYVPWHCVLRNEKIRNVFNFSRKSKNGVSLNDVIYPGPSLQARLQDIIYKNRMFSIIVIADIEKFYRQILLLPEDAERARILRRIENVTKEYRLNTISQGIVCGSWQANRARVEVGNRATDSEVKDVIINQFYMDDMNVGFHSAEKASRIIKAVDETLLAYHLPLLKFYSNKPEVLDFIDYDRLLISKNSQLYEEKTLISMLGLTYNPKSDSFQFSFEKTDPQVTTKRKMLSKSASIFDPIGFFGPISLHFKLMLQKVFYLKVDWDQIIPEKMAIEFNEQFQQLHKLNELRISRWIESIDDDFSLIGFADSSSKAFGCVVYSRVKKNEKFVTHLFTSKSRVVPIASQSVSENQLTIPKLELAALELLVDTFEEIKSALNLKKLKCFAFSDSKVVISWMLQSEPENRQVRKKVKKIQRKFDPAYLAYCKTDENPADLVSRSQKVDVFMEKENLHFWFKGPKWLSNCDLPVNDQLQSNQNNPPTSVSLIQTQHRSEEILQRFSSYDKMIKVIFFVLSFLRHVKLPKFDVANYFATETTLIKLHQKEFFPREIRSLTASKLVHRTSKLFRFSPFLDDNGIIRIGGRLSNCDYLSYDEKFPIVLEKSKFAYLIILKTHRQNHSGATQVHHLVRERFFIFKLKSQVKFIKNQCVLCARFKSKVVNRQLMSEIPRERLALNRAFFNTSMDFCGFFTLYAHKLRRATTVKAWVCVFTCMTTRAVHFEVAEDLTADAFLRCLERFIARRGTPKTLVSDNGSNFVSNRNSFEKAYKTMIDNIQSSLISKGITFKNNPPYSPNFCGIVEIIVKMFKSYLKHMENQTKLSYETFETIVCKIEHCINSRPLYAINSDDSLALTPSHFLLTKNSEWPINTVDFKSPLTRKWLIREELTQKLWETFKNEYIKSLIVRNKWLKISNSIKANDVVIVKDDRDPPSRWPLGRVLALHPDTKNLSRVATVLKRGKEERVSMFKLIRLPTEDEFSLFNGELNSNDEKNALTSEIVGKPNIEERENSDDSNDPAENETSIVDNSIDEKHKPTVRRSARIANLMMSVIYLLLLIPTIFATNLNNSKIFELSVGLNIFHVRPIFHQKGQFDLKINTDYDVNERFEQLNKSVKKFTDMCDHDELKNCQLISFCTTIADIIFKRKVQIQQNIMALIDESQISRSKRAYGKIAVFAIGSALSAGQAFYQEYQNRKLNERVDDTQDRVSKAIKVSLNMTENSINEQNDKIDEMIAEQNCMKLKSNILIEEVQLNLILEQELDDVKKLKDLDPSPYISNEIKSKLLINLRKTSIILVKNHIVIVFVIPIIDENEFNEYLLVSTDAKIVHLNNDKRVNLLHVNKAMTMFSVLNASDFATSGLYDGFLLENMTSCVIDILNSSKNLHNCPFVKSHENIISHTIMNYYIISNLNQIKCHGKNFNLNFPSKIALIEVTNCSSIYYDIDNIEIETNISLNNGNESIASLLNDQKLISTLQKHLRIDDEINEILNFTKYEKNPMYLYIFVGIFIIVLLLMGLLVFKNCIKSKKKIEISQQTHSPTLAKIFQELTETP